MPGFSQVFEQPPLPNPGEPRGGGGPGAWRGGRHEEEKWPTNTKWITGEIGGQAENLFNDPERNPTARPTYFESEPVLAVMQCQANLTKKCAVPDHIWPFGHRKRIFGGLSVSF